MKRLSVLAPVAIASTTLAALLFSSGRADDESSPIFGIRIPSGYRDWRLISVAHEEGALNDLRAILGNDVAIEFLPGREGSIPGRRDHRPARLELRPVGGKRQSLWPSPIFRGRATQERGSVHGQGLEKIRLDRRLGVRSIQRRQTRRRGGAENLLSLSRDRQSARLRLQPLRALKPNVESDEKTRVRIKLLVRASRIQTPLGSTGISTQMSVMFCARG